MNIEGAEADVAANSRSFLREHPIHFAIESNHEVQGELTYKRLERLFREIGYQVLSSEQFAWGRSGTIILSCSLSLRQPFLALRSE